MNLKLLFGMELRRRSYVNTFRLYSRHVASEGTLAPDGRKYHQNGTWGPRKPSRASRKHSVAQGMQRFRATANTRQYKLS